MVQNTYQYQAFGSLYGSATENVANTRRFTGAEWNSEDSSQTHGVRRYFSNLGRWNRSDPLGLHAGDANLYRYVANRPVLFLDPTGLALGGGCWNPLNWGYNCLYTGDPDPPPELNNFFNPKPAIALRRENTPTSPSGAHISAYRVEGLFFSQGRWRGSAR